MTDLKILIKTILDDSQQNINNLNNQIETISKKLNKINLGISPDASKGLKEFTQTSSVIAKQINSIKTPKFDLANQGQEAKLYLNRINSLVTGLKRFNGEVKYTYDELGKVNVKVQDAEGLLKKYTFQWDSVRKVLKRTNRQDTDLSDITKEKQLQFELKTRQKLEQDFKKQIDSNLQSIQKYYNSQQQAIQKNIALKQKELEQLKKSAVDRLGNTANTEHWLNIQKRDFESSALKFSQQKKGLYDESELDGILKRFKDLEHTSPKVRKEVELLKSEFKRLDANAVAKGLNTANKSAISFGESIKTAAFKMAIWTGVGGAIFGMLGVLKEIPTVIIDIDSKLTEMAKVMSTDTNFAELMRQLSESANTYGRTITESQDALIEFAKQGYEAEQAIQLANTALLGANVTGIKTGQMAEYLTSTLAQFNMTAEQSVEVINKVNEVDNNFAVTSQGLAESISKAGETAQQFGVTLDELLGFTTAIATSTKESGRIIGNALKFMFPRLNSDKAIEALNSIKVSTKDVSGELRSATHIYADVANKWDAMSRAERTYVAESLAGKHHITRFMALMGSWSLSMDATRTSQQSLFSSLEENRKHMESLEAQISKTKSAGQELTFALGEKGLKSAMSGVLGVTTSFLKGITEITDNASILGVVLGATLIGSLAVTALKVGSLSTALSGAATAMATFTATALSNPFILLGTAIVAVTAGTITFIGHQRQLREEMEKVSKSADEANEKFKELIETTKQVGLPTLGNVNDIEKQITTLDQLLVKMREVQGEQQKKQGRVNFDELNFQAIPQDIKDITTALGINITQFETWGSLIAEVNTRLSSLSGALGEAKRNSSEYQAEQIRVAQTELDSANNSKALVEEYNKLSSAKNKNAEQTKRLAELEIILMNLFPEQYKNGKLNIELMNIEANTLVRLAEENQKRQQQQLITNRKLLQSNYETAVKNIGLYQKEAEEARKLWNARNNAKSSSPVDQFAKDIIDPKWKRDMRLSQNLTNSQNKITQEETKKNQLADSIKQVDDILNWKPAPITAGGDTKKSGGSSSSAQQKEFKDVADAQIAMINNQVELDKKLEDSLERRIKVAKEEKNYTEQIELNNDLLNQQNKIVSDLTTANNKLHQEANKVRAKSGFSDTLKWFNAAGEASEYYINKFNKASVEQQKQLQKTFDHLQKLGKSYNTNADEINKYGDAIRSTKSEISSLNQELKDAQFKNITTTLEKQRKKYLDGIKDEEKSALEDIKNTIKNTTEQYENQVKIQEEKLKALDKEIEKENRLLKLNELQSEIDKTKADRRFEFIDAQGNKILAYDIAKVMDLEQQQSELNRQYANDDAKQVIQDEIDRLNDEKDKRLEVLQSELDTKEEYYNKLIEQDTEKWEKLITSAQDGTLKFTDVMNNWYIDVLTKMQDFGGNLATEVKNITDLFNSVGTSAKSASKSTSTTSAKQSEINKISKDQNVDLGIAELIYKSKHETKHNGGIIGDTPSSGIMKEVNNLFNKKGEKLILGKLGELVIPKENIMNNFIPNLVNFMKMPKFNNSTNNTPANNQTVYKFENVSVNANNVTEFIASIRHIQPI